MQTKSPRLKTNWQSLFLVVLFFPGLVGCPDYSHLREPPDYATMTDGGSEQEAELSDDDFYESD